jgi:hypothetical protein
MILRKEIGSMPGELDLLNSLLDGNPADAKETTPPDTETPDAADVGGDPNLESDTPPEKSEEGAEGKQTEDPALEAERSRANAAFAKMRAENTKYTKVMSQLAQALGIDMGNPSEAADRLAELAVQKLAAAQNVPVELYRELNMTKDQLQQMQYTQNVATAREKFGTLKTTYNLTQPELEAFAAKLDEEGIMIVQDPSIDLEYHYYRLYKNKIEEKRIQAAVEAALKKSNTADSKSTTPSKQSSRTHESSDAKINTVSALNDLLDGKQ